MIAIFISYLMISGNQANTIHGRINISSTPSVTALRGDNTTLVCQWQETNNCQKQATAVWFKCADNNINCTAIPDRPPLDCTEPTTQTPSRNVFERNSCNVSIRNVQLKDGGKYMCQLTGCSSPGTVISELVVNVPPTDMFISNQTHNFTETDNAICVDPDLTYRINCSVYGSKPAAELRWILDDRNVTGNVTETPVITSGNNTGLWNTHSQLTLTENDGESLVCLASFPGSAILSRQLQLHLQGDLQSPHPSANTSSDITGSSSAHVTTFTTMTTSKPTTMDDVTDAKYTVVSISVSSGVVFAAVVLVILVVVYRKGKNKRSRTRLPSRRMPTDYTRINTQFPTVEGAVLNQRAEENDYQERQEVISEIAPEIPARAPPTLPSQASASAVLGQRVLSDNLTRMDSATNDMEMEATVSNDVRRHRSVELVYADLALNQRAEGRPAQCSEQPTVYARLNYNERGDFQVSDEEDDEDDEDDPPPVPPRLLRRPPTPPDDHWQPEYFHRSGECEDMPNYLEDYK